MRRPLVLAVLVGIGALFAFWLLLQTPGSVGDALWHPFQMLIGGQNQLNSTLLEVSETAEPVRTAGRRLLQPLGMVRVLRIYDSSDSDRSKKR